MKARIDYVKNPDKTEDGELISAYACAPKTAAEEFVGARKQFITTTDLSLPRFNRPVTVDWDTPIESMISCILNP